MRRSIGLLCGSAAALVMLATGCGGAGHTSPIVLYNGQHTQLTTAIVSAFEKQTGISVRVRTNDSVVLADQILQEGKASPADVYISENSPEIMSLQEHGLLAKLPASILSQVPADDSSPTGHWVGVALRISSLVYNPSLVKASALPATVLDLAEPKWKDKVAIAPSDSDFPPIVSAVRVRYGPAKAATWLAGLKRNARTYQDEEAVVAAVNSGDVATGIINHYYWYRLRLEIGAKAMHSELHFFPSSDVGSITNISGAAMLATSKNKADAERFVAFLVSRQGQKILASGDDYEYPARPDVPPNPELPPLASIPHARLSVTQLGDDKGILDLLENSGLL